MRTDTADMRMLTVTDAPHIKGPSSVRYVMLNFMLSASALLIFGVYSYGPRVLSLLAISCGSAVAFEFLFCRITKKKNSLKDMSAVCGGMLICCALDPSAPLWIPAVAAFFSTVVFKLIPGGLGKSLVNPIAASMLLIYTLFPNSVPATVQRGTVLPMFGGAGDFTSAASPLASLRDGFPTPVKNLLLGDVSSAIGCLSALLISVAALNLILKHIVNPALPLSLILTVAAVSSVFPKGNDPAAYVLNNCLCGTLLFAAFFIATDFSSSPVTVRGKISYGAACGIITVFIRSQTGFTEGVFLAICITDLLVPLAEKAENVLLSKLRKGAGA